MKQIALTLALMAFSHSAQAEIPEIVGAEAQQRGDSWTFSVTLEHPDTGWDHYADGWEVLAPDGTSLGVRVLAHPHENEQPFTRSLSGVSVPDGVTQVLIRARCNQDGWGPSTYTLDLPG